MGKIEEGLEVGSSSINISRVIGEKQIFVLYFSSVLPAIKFLK